MRFKAVFITDPLVCVYCTV